LNYKYATENTNLEWLEGILAALERGFEVVSLETTETQSLLDQADTSLDFVARKENVKQEDSAGI
jgi:hypothetical protein